MREGGGPVRTGSRGTSRLVPLDEPRAVRVRTGEGDAPVAVEVDGRLRRVEAVRETWRIDDEWWRRPIARLYHALVLEGGAPATLYRDLVSGGWHLHG